LKVWISLWFLDLCQEWLVSIYELQDHILLLVDFYFNVIIREYFLILVLLVLLYFYTMMGV
jgi:hypothetical protein